MAHHAIRPGSLPNSFTRLAFARAMSIGFFIATAVITGKTSKAVSGSSFSRILAELDLDSGDALHLRAAFALSSICTSVASVWSIVNLFCEATDHSRRVALLYSFALDFVVASATLAAIVLEKISLSTGRCHGSNFTGPASASKDAKGWCGRFELSFRLIIAAFILHGIALIISSRFYMHEWLARSQADADDWAKELPPKFQKIMKTLQAIAAPFRFAWRCLCKISHASQNPIQWAILLVILIVPLILVLMCRMLWILIKRLISTAKIVKAKRTQKEQSAISRLPLGDNAVDSSSVSLQSLEGESVSNARHEITSMGSLHSGAGFSAAPFDLKAWWTKSATETPNAPGLAYLERLFAHPDIFYIVVSQIHGADLRALMAVSRMMRDTIRGHWAIRPAAVKACLCSRVPDEFVAELVSESAIPAVLRRQKHGPTECWSCGVTICPSCHSERGGLHISRAEIRLRSLTPVCSSCYFKSLLGPTGFFGSMSAKCACTATIPPKGVKQLCRDCARLGSQIMWKKRLRRGATMKREELPAGWVGWLRHEDSMQENINLRPVGPQQPRLTPDFAPRMATQIKYCHCCNGKLWWFFGESRGLRWWRCSNCQLEARDVLMSTGREFA